MVNIYKLKLTMLQQEILRLLFVKSGDVLNQRRIANLLEVSPPAVMKALPKLEQEQLIKISQDKESKRWSIELNRDNSRVMQLKRADNLKQLYECGLADFLEREFAGSTIVLFGSYSKGEDTADSDVDVAIIGRKSKGVNTLSFEKMLERRVNINFYNSFNSINKHLKENIFNGIVIEGGIEL